MTIEEAVRNAMRGKCIPYRKETKGKLNEILQENAELKRLLKLAIDDLNIVKTHLSDFYCELTDCDDCPYTIGLQGCKWKHYSDAMKLIGENER